MTIQMREGWAVRRDKEVCRYVRDETHKWGKTNPWVPIQRGCFSCVRNDGGLSTVEDKSEFDGDVIELLDPWDARVPEEHREKRFVVGAFLDRDGDSLPCVFDREKMVGAGFPGCYFGDCIERVAAECNADFEGGGNIQYSWSPKHMLTIDGKPCNPDGSPIAETPDPVKAEPFKVVDPPSRTTRTLQTEKWTVYAEQLGDAEPKVTIDARSPDACSVADARALVAAILAACDEIEADHRKPAE